MDEIKKIYIQLKTLHESLIPSIGDKSATLADANIWNNFNTKLNQLCKLTQDDHFLSLAANPTSVGGGRQFILTSNLARSVYQATSYLFETQNLADQLPPIKPENRGNGNITQTSISHQNQENFQNTHINIEFNQTLTYVTEVLVEAKSDYPEDTKERTFIDKVKSGLSTTKNTAEIIRLILTTASELGIAVDILSKLFK